MSGQVGDSIVGEWALDSSSNGHHRTPLGDQAGCRQQCNTPSLQHKSMKIKLQGAHVSGCMLFLTQSYDVFCPRLPRLPLSSSGQSPTLGGITPQNGVFRSRHSKIMPSLAGASRQTASGTPIEWVAKTRIGLHPGPADVVRTCVRNDECSLLLGGVFWCAPQRYGRRVCVPSPTPVRFHVSKSQRGRIDNPGKLIETAEPRITSPDFCVASSRYFAAYLND